MLRVVAVSRVVVGATLSLIPGGADCVLLPNMPEINLGRVRNFSRPTGGSMAQGRPQRPLETRGRFTGWHDWRLNIEK